ncbi:MAG: hypothetical protein U1A78_29665 [Polyangia bacterium]
MKTQKTTHALLNPLNNRPAMNGQKTAFFALLRSNPPGAFFAPAKRPALLKTRPGDGSRR